MRSLAPGWLLLLLPAVAAADVPRYHTTLDARIEDPVSYPIELSAGK